MKVNFKTLLFLFLAFAMSGVFTACSEDDDLSNGGKPMISYIRVTKPTASDSLIVKAGQGKMVAIVGDNLANVKELWFNDQPASLNPSYITNTTIITRIPAQIPTTINNKLRMVFANGEELLHDFTVDISKPRIDRMMSEYVNTGENAIIVGDFFYEPLKVTFTGGVQGEIVSIKDFKTLEVKVPQGAQPGPITITSNFGETESVFWFRDNRNLIATFDAGTSGLWHGPNFIKESDATVKPINGKFLRIDNNLGAWAWYETYVGEQSSVAATENKNIPADAFANPAKYSLKFEINTQESLTGAWYRMYMGPDMAGKRGDVYYNWQPNLHTEGKWQTVTIPWEDFWKANKEFAYNANGYGVSMHFSGPNAVKAKFAIDNMRVVPNTKL
ncbi:glycan-binding surface protein [Rufibacter soli]